MCKSICCHVLGWEFCASASGTPAWLEQLILSQQKVWCSFTEVAGESMAHVRDPFKILFCTFDCFLKLEAQAEKFLLLRIALLTSKVDECHWWMPIRKVSWVPLQEKTNIHIASAACGVSSKYKLNISMPRGGWKVTGRKSAHVGSAAVTAEYRLNSAVCILWDRLRTLEYCVLCTCEALRL